MAVDIENGYSQFNNKGGIYSFKDLGIFHY